MIKTRDELIEIIERKIINKYGSFSLTHDMEYQLKWLGGHKVKVSAWQEKWGSTMNNVEFVVSMSKDLMRDEERKLYEWIFNKKQSDKLYNWLYPNGKVYREYEKRHRKKLQRYRL